MVNTFKKNIKEIGSEFSYCDKFLDKNHRLLLPKVGDYIFVFSGRTAIDCVIQDICNLKKVALPSYCCESMAEPFKNNNIEIVYYDVNFRGGLCIDIDSEINVDAILWCNYFGFRIDMPDFTNFKKNGGIIIEDITHSFFSNKQFDTQSDYLVASLRKWGPLISGGYCGKIKGCFEARPYNYPSEEFISIKYEAMRLKSDFLLNNSDLMKYEFLYLFEKSNKLLADDYKGLLIDNYSKDKFLDIFNEKNKEIRRENSLYIYKNLKNKDIEFIFDENILDCPLFVPIYTTEVKRNELRKLLIDNLIYCPIHWPGSNEKKSNLYNGELSLICDQRYDCNDMKRMVDIINKWQGDLE